MATSYWKILEIETLAEKLEFTLGICLNLVNSFLRCDQVCHNFQKCAREYFLGTILHQLSREKKAG